MAGRYSDAELLAYAGEIAGYAKPSAPLALRRELRRTLMIVEVARPVPFGGFLALFAPARLRPVVAVALVLVLLLGSGGFAAASSLPGEPAFALKRAAEEVEVALSLDDAGRVMTLVTQSERRLADLEAAIARRPAAVVASTEEYLAAVRRLDAALAALLASPPSARRDAALTLARAASERHVAVLEALTARLPAQAQGGIERALEVQREVQGKSVRDRAPGEPARPASPPASPNAPARTPPGRPSISPPGRP